MPKLLSIDVGIKNLAFCLFSKEGEKENEGEWKVTKWDIVNLADSETYTCGHCDKPAKYSKQGIFYCTKHAKKQTAFLMPTAAQKPAFIKKQTTAKLLQLAQDYKLDSVSSNTKKAMLVTMLNTHIGEKYLDAVETTKAREVDLFTAGINLRNKFNQVFQDEERIETVIIENQIGPLAIRMKTIQGMLVQYFVMSTLQVQHIEFISASNKLKECDAKDKEKYSDRKKLGIAKCLEFLQKETRFQEHLVFFNTHKKKDDLSDSFLQGIWYLRTKQ